MQGIPLTSFSCHRVACFNHSNCRFLNKRPPHCRHCTTLYRTVPKVSLNKQPPPLISQIRTRYPVAGKASKRYMRWHGMQVLCATNAYPLQGMHMARAEIRLACIPRDRMPRITRFPRYCTHVVNNVHCTLPYAGYACSHVECTSFALSTLTRQHMDR